MKRIILAVCLASSMAMTQSCVLQPAIAQKSRFDLQTAQNVAGLAGLSVADGGMVRTLGYTTAGDGGGNVYRYDASSAATVNGGSVVNGPGSSGRYIAIDQEVANVKQFGAVGDGVADDISALQAAQDAAQAAGSRVHVPPGTYIVSSTWAIKADTEGVGQKSRIKIIGGVGGTVATITAASVDVADVTVKDLLIDGNWTGNATWLAVGSANYGIKVSANNATLQNVRATDVTGNGMGVPNAGVKNARFINCESDNNGKKGFHSGDVSDVQIIGGLYHNNDDPVSGIGTGIGMHQGMTRAAIIGAHVYDNGLYGINFDNTLGAGLGAEQGVISGNLTWGNGTAGILIGGSGDTYDELSVKAVATGNICEDPILVTAASDVIVSNNLIKDSFISVDTCSRVTVSGNHFPQQTVADVPITVRGIALGSTSLTESVDCIVEKNVIDAEASTEGIVTGSGARDCIIRGNHFSSNGTNYDVRIYGHMETMLVDQKGRLRLESYTAPNGIGSIGEMKIIEGSAAPTVGTWNAGDSVRNDTPSETGDGAQARVLREFVCLTGGEPGTWVAQNVATNFLPQINSPAQITANQNNYTPSADDVWRLSSDAERTITGIAGGSAGEIRTLINVGSNGITLGHQDTASSAANRIILAGGKDIRIAPDQSVRVIYDDTDSRWRVLSFQRPHAAHGGIGIESNAIATTIASSSTDFTNKVQVNFNLASTIALNTTPSAANNDVTIDLAGDYGTHADLSLTGTAGDVVSFAIFKNNGLVQLVSRATITLTGDVDHVSVHPYAAPLDVNDTVEVWIQNETAGRDVTIEDGHLSVYKIAP